MDFCFLDNSHSPTKEQVGGKGFYLHQMSEMGLPVPPAALLTTELWAEYQKSPKKTIAKLKNEIIPAVVEHLRASNGGQMPLVSVRSSGAVSMPGMMDTILNVGVDDDFVTRRKTKSKSKAGGAEAGEFGVDVYARFLSMYGHTVLGINKDQFDAHQTFKTLEEAKKHFTKVYSKNNHALPPTTAEDQILNCVVAVFDSWDNERAKLYRKLHKIPDSAGTAVVIQRMVFGNKNDASATGVVFSRNPNNGDMGLVGEYLVNAQGEDVVSGSHTPLGLDTLEEDFPEAFASLKKISQDLERHYQQVQDIEFTIEDDRLFILQARTAKCSPFAKLRLLMDLQRRNEIQAQSVFDGLSLAEYLDLNVRQIDPNYNAKPDGTGLAASMGALKARVVFGPSTKYKGDPTVFLAKETTPDDLQAIHMAAGILTASGGATSHAAVVARGMGKICIVGCSDLKIMVKDGVEQATLGGKTLVSGDWITLDANLGRVWIGQDPPVIDAKNTKIFWDLEDLVFEANPQWARVTSKVDELVAGNPSCFLTYGLDDVDEEDLKNELFDATRFLTGVMDLTGKLDFLQSKYSNQFLFADLRAEQIFLRKKDIMLNLGLMAPPDQKFDFEVYLGPYEDKHAWAFRNAGYAIREAKDISFDGSNPKASMIISQDGDSNVPDGKMAISSRNALLRVLK